MEKAMRLSDRLGGHLVSGHVDGVGEVIHFAPVAAAATAELAPGHPRAGRIWARYLAPKGSIAVNGVSLTVNQVDGQRFFHQPDSRTPWSRPC
jgi:riboflavin synthase